MSSNNDEKPWPSIIIDILMMFVSFGLFIYFGYIESEGGRHKMMWLVVLLYKAFGKVGTAVFFAAVGVYYIRKGVLGLMRSED
jgi:hypothetical protein